mmetsp:Transcript_6356/g.22367  ORF Transcript_6356/g.22367 Transcript_6356/m.22367 type:complete len:217 (+) Transcript_6356:64-714(+)
MQRISRTASSALNYLQKHSEPSTQGWWNRSCMASSSPYPFQKRWTNKWEPTCSFPLSVPSRSEPFTTSCSALCESLILCCLRNHTDTEIFNDVVHSCRVLGPVETFRCISSYMPEDGITTWVFFNVRCNIVHFIINDDPCIVRLIVLCDFCFGVCCLSVPFAGLRPSTAFLLFLAAIGFHQQQQECKKKHCCGCGDEGLRRRGFHGANLRLLVVSQ